MSSSSRQMDLFSTGEIVAPDDSSAKQTADYLGITEVRLHYEAAEELRSIAGDFDVELFETDLIFGFPFRTVLLEYFARLHELAYQNWLLKNASTLQGKGFYDAEKSLPSTLEQYVSNLVLFTYDCWTTPTRASADGGIDGIIYSSWKKNPICGIQAKLYCGSVPIGDIRDFYGSLLTSRPRLRSGLFFTSSHRFPKVPRAPDIELFLVDGNALDSLLNLIGLASDWFITYAGCYMDIPPYSTDFPEIAARLIAIRKKVDELLNLGRIIPLRWERGVSEQLVKKWVDLGPEEF